MQWMDVRELVAGEKTGARADGQHAKMPSRHGALDTPERAFAEWPVAVRLHTRPLWPSIAGI